LSHRAKRGSSHLDTSVRQTALWRISRSLKLKETQSIGLSEGGLREDKGLNRVKQEDDQSEIEGVSRSMLRPDMIRDSYLDVLYDVQSV
jgi:hypothetical protein